MRGLYFGIYLTLWTIGELGTAASLITLHWAPLIFFALVWALSIAMLSLEGELWP